MFSCAQRRRGGGAVTTCTGACCVQQQEVTENPPLPVVMENVKVVVNNRGEVTPTGKSPGCATPKKPVLTGSARKVKDNAADWHNLMLKWENLNDGAFGAASKIVNLRISNLSYEKMLVDDPLPANENAKDKEELERMCSELVDTLESMQQIQMKMEKLTWTFKGVCDLEAFQWRGETPSPVLFQTWPTSLFYETSQKMSDMFKKEMALKRTIVGEIAHTPDQDLLMVYLSCWLYQPYVDNGIKVLLESMLMETGHRTI